MKTFANVTMSISLNIQSMVRNAGTTAEVWDILNNCFLRRNKHNGVQMRRELHEFQINNGEDIMGHFLKFKELLLSMTAKT